MDNNKKTARSRVGLVRVGMAVSALLFAAMTVLTALIIGEIAFGSAKNGNGDGRFDLESITAERLSDTMDFSRYLLPEFIGFVSDGEGLGVSGSANTAKDIMCSLSELFSRLIVRSNITTVLTGEEGGAYFAKLLDENDGYVYIRMHTSVSDAVFGAFCDMYSGADNERRQTGADIYELVLLPYSERSGSISAVVSDGKTGGSVAVYTLSRPETIITPDDIDEYIKSYRGSLTPFEFAKDGYKYACPTEPVFTEPIYTKSLIITSSTAAMLVDSPSELDAVQSIFRLNPDKLMSSRETGGELSLVDTQGMLFIYDSAVEYISNDVGISVTKILGYGAKDIEDYIAAAVELFTSLRAVSKNYTGGDAEIMLTAMTAEGDTVNVEFSYFFDNIRLTGCEPALSVTFENGNLTHARLYTAAVRSLGDRTQSYDEWWFLSSEAVRGKGRKLHNCALSYRCDVSSDTVKAGWRGEY